jgi:hypothetical protein
MHLPYTSPKIVLDLISVVDWYESFLKYLIAEKNTHDTRTSLRSRAWAWGWLSRATCPRPRTLAMPPHWCFTLHKKHCHQHVEIESQMSQFQRTDGSHEMTK